MLQLIDLFQNQGFAIIFASAAQESDFSFDLESIQVAKQKIKLNCSIFDEFVSTLNPEMVLFDRYVIEEQFGWRVYENCGSAIRILDTEDLHCLRLERQNAIKKNIDFELSDLLNSDVAKREIASMYRCDLTLMISEVEMEILTSLFGINISLLHYLPLFYDLQEEDSLLKFNVKKDFIFIGNFLHEPNYDAVKQLKEKIWAKIHKQLPETKLHIYGAYPSQKIWQLHNEKNGFLVHGRADNAAEVIKSARILLAPLRFGAGLKGKILEAMLVGTPTVTTYIGLEGICDSNFSDVSKLDDFDNFDGFVSKAIKLYQEEIVFENAQKKGIEIIKSRFEKEIFMTTFESRILDLKINIHTNRKQNFTGTLLLHHLNLSTKYMSRWIQEKNKSNESL